MIRLSELLIDRFQRSRPLITSVFLSSPRLYLYFTENEKYQDSVRFRQKRPGKQKNYQLALFFGGSLIFPSLLFAPEARKILTIDKSLRI